MSESGGSAMSRVSDEGTQRTAGGGGEVDLGCSGDDETFSSCFEDVPSRVDGNGVITWLRPVGEARVDAF